MLFPTYQFLFFFLVIFSFGFSWKDKVDLYKIFLLSVSLIFYSFWSLNFLSLLVASTASSYCFIRILYQYPLYKKNTLIFGLSVNLLYLGIFKYYNFFVEPLSDLLNSLKIPSNLQNLQIIAPIGISFYTFRMIAHLADCYNNKLPCPNFLDYATYITYFPQIASGPISRAKEFYEQLNSEKKYNYSLEEVIILILSGLFKKYTLSSFLFEFTQLPFSVPQQYSSIDLILAAIAYSCLIYVDFSGYSDLANGISCLLGFAPIRNFDRPYSSSSLQEFWRRWHVSLSEWLRDYLYIPLGGNKQGKTRKYINLFLTMLIGGFWHGAGVNFIIWGGLHGLGLVANHFWKDSLKPKLLQFQPGSFAFQLSQVSCWFLTFSFISFTWIFFNTQSWENAVDFIQGIFYSEVKEVQFNFWQLHAVFFTVIALINFWGNGLTRLLKRLFAIKNLSLQVICVSLFVYVILMLGPSSVPPFIYFNF